MDTTSAHRPAIGIRNAARGIWSLGRLPREAIFAASQLDGLHRFGEMYDLVGLIAPRPMLVEAGDHDPIFPIAAVKKSVEIARKVYAVFGAEEGGVSPNGDVAGIYDSDTGALVASIPDYHPWPAVSADGTRVATLDGNGIIRVLNAETGALIAESPSAELFKDANSIEFLPDGRTVVVRQPSFRSGAIDAATGEILYRLRPGLERVRVAPGGKRLFAKESVGELLHIFEARTGRQLASIHANRFLDFIGEDGFLVWQAIFDEATSEVNHLVIIYRRIRPEQWWGVFWLWHFWFIIALGVAVAWSGWRDVRRMRRLERESENANDPTS